MDHICVIAIDIATTHSCCAHSPIHSPQDINMLQKWEGYDYLTTKVPTAVLFNKKKEFHSFGFEAINHFNGLKNDEERKRWYMFEGFHKLTNNYVQTEPELPDKSGKKLETYKVYGSIIKVFIARIYAAFHDRNVELSQGDLQIVITVPPICTKSYKTMLQNAYHFTGYTNPHSFVRETEAILQYWENKCDTEQRLSENPNFKKTSWLLLVNLRGRTASITALSTQDGTPRRLHTVAGGGWGGQAVNEEFKQFLIKIVGAPVFLKFVEEEEEEWMDLKMKFETIKHGVKSEDDGKVTLKLPPRLHDILEECCSENVQAAVQASPYSKKISFIGDKIRLDVSILKDLFTNSVEKIVSNIKETLQIEAVTGTKTIIMVGGFSKSPLVQSAVKEAFPDCNVLVPEDPAHTLLKGAVMQGHYVKPENESVTAVSKFTYGVHVCHINDEHGCSEIEKEETKIFLRKGETIPVGDRVTRYITLETCDMQHVEIQFFTSPRTETVSVDESEIVYLEKVRHDFDGLHTTTIKTEMLFHSLCFGKVDMQPHQFVSFL